VETNVGRSRLEAIHGRLKTDLKRLETIIGRLMSYLGRLETILGAARTVCVAHMAAATTITKSLRSMLIGGCQPHIRPLGSACEQPLAHGLAASVVCAPKFGTIFFILYLKGTGSRNEYFLSLCYYITLYQKFEMYVPRNETARPHSQFLHSCI
jgi:hypothetical protein